MEYQDLDRRAYKRIKTPGVIVSYKQEKFFSSKKQYAEELHPVVDISRGGMRFMEHEPFTTASKISLKIFLPAENSPIILKGRVRWASLNPTIIYKYQIGIQFNSFGMKKGHNHPEILEKIIELEKKFLIDNKAFAH
jgi:hypothetical protein